MEIPITNHPKLPDKVPLVADFHDDRNRLSYYYPLLREIDGVRTPITKFFPINGDFNHGLDIEYREVTAFMQDIGVSQAFVRGDFSSAKYDEKGRHIDSQDAFDIQTTAIEMFRQLFRTERNIGGRFAVREWIPHDTEVRYFLRDGDMLYADSLDGPGADWPLGQARKIARQFNTFAWSCDFIRHEKTGKWYCIDMGLDGLYWAGTQWVDISEHLWDEHSSEQYADEMPRPETFNY